MEKTYNVLFLCTGNSARSIIAEALLNSWGRGQFNAYSAGSHPTGTVNPFALKILQQMRISVKNPRSKNWDEFAQQDSPVMDFVFTVCDQAAGEACPAWPGQPMSAHWGIADPAAAEGDEVQKMLAFRQAFNELENRIKIFVNLPIGSLDKIKLQKQLDAIGKVQTTTAEAS